jgi:hypothetical protein
MAQNAYDYTTIFRPYDDNIERSTDQSITDVLSLGNVDIDSSQDIVGGSVDGSQVSSPSQINGGSVSGQSFDNIWITSWIKSQNYKPKTQGFYLNSQEGYIECNKLYVGSGGIIGGSIDIPDDTTANSYHVDSNGDTWWGCNVANWTADHNNANAYVLSTGVAKFQSVTLSGSVIATDFQPGTDIAIQGWTSSVAFVASDYRTVTWSAGGTGQIKILDGTTYTIAAGTTGNMAARTYIYLDINVSIVALQFTTTATTAVGKGKILVCVAWPNTDTTSKSQFQTFGGYGGNMLGVDFLAADSASVNEFVSNTAQIKDLTVTNAKIATLNDGKIIIGTFDSAQLLDNGDFEDWSAGVAVAPDSWTKAPAGGGSIARVASPKIGTYAAQLTSDVDGDSLYQSIHAEKGIAYWRGRTVTYSGWIYSAWANTGRIAIFDGAGVTYSDYHTGGASYELLTVTRTIDAGATEVTIVTNNDGNTKTILIDACMAVEGDFPVPFAPKFRDWGQAGNYTKIDGGNISVSSSISINSATWATQGIQLDYQGGTPRAYIGNGSTQYFQFDGTNVEIAGTLTIGSVPSLPQDSNLVGYWSFDEGSGSTVYDYSPNANHGTITDCTFVTGRSGKALSFNALTSIVSITDAATIRNIFDGGGGATIEVWFLANSDGENDTGVIIGKQVWNLRTDSEAGGYIRLGFAYAFSGTAGQWATAVDISLDAWHHVQISYSNDDVANDPVIIVDGVNKTVTEIQAPVGARTSDGGQGLYIGNVAADNQCFDGYIDEVRYYDATLSLNNAKAFYSNPSGNQLLNVASDKGLVGGWVINATTIANGTNIILDAANKKISINSATYGAQGIQLDYNAGTPRAYIGNGTDKYFQFDGTNTSASSIITALQGSSIFSNCVLMGGGDVGVPMFHQMNTDVLTGSPNYIYQIEVYVAGNTDIYVSRFSLSDSGVVLDKKAATFTSVGLVGQRFGIVRLGSYIFVSMHGGVTNEWIYIASDLSGAWTSLGDPASPLTTSGPMATDGTNLYALCSTTVVRKFTWNSGTLTLTYDSAITLDNAIETNQCFWCDGTYFYGMDDTTGAIRKFSLAGALVSTSTTILPIATAGMFYSFFKYGSNYFLGAYNTATEQTIGSAIKPF